MQHTPFARGVGRATPPLHTWDLVRRWVVLGVALIAGLGIAGCAQDENVILLEVISPQRVGELTVTVIPLDGSGAPDSAPRPVNMDADEIRANPLRVAIRLGAPREVMVVLSAPGPAGSDTTLVAQRCMSVVGVVRDSVWLVELGPSEDPDRDGFPTRDGATCARPSEDLTTLIPCLDDDPIVCHSPREGDCGPNDATRHPGAPEVCADGIDQNCDGADAECEDADDDGFSGCRTGDDPTTCDCNDTDPMTFPFAPDPCDDGLDQDCDRADDHCDADCDGYPAGRAGEDDPWVDCNDGEDDGAATHPNETLRGVYDLADGDRRARGCNPMPMTTSASDMCTAGAGGEPVGDSIDQDCNGFVDDGPGCTDTNDRDRDGSRACMGGTTTGCDTNDCDPGIAPTREEVCGNAFDEDGDGTAQPCMPGDADMDGHIEGVDDCDDTDPQVYAGAPENCLTPESESCTENISCTAFGGDADGDGYLTGLPAGARGDCEDRASFMVGTVMFSGADIFPFAGEDPCDSVDNDCDGIVDEVLRAASSAPGAADGCVRTGGGATDVDYHLSAQYSEYCGGCGVVTAPNQDCCAGAPTDVDQPDSCGTCGYDCGPHTSCPSTGMDIGGAIHDCACAPDALGNWDDCNASLTGASGGDGCESDLDTDEMNCGACGTRCGPNTTCRGGTCVCDAPFLDCDGNLLAPSGCEINGSNDVNNCNMCGNRCMFASGSPVCNAGRCELAGCDLGFSDCNSMPTDGCETNLRTTLNRCGMCSTDCNANLVNTQTAGRECAAGVCNFSSCSPNFDSCDGNRANGCETNLQTTLSACGSCSTNCNSTLSNTQMAGRTCAAGVCNYGSCSSNFGDCDANRANGCEIDLRSTTTACGMCTTNCNTTLANTQAAGRTCGGGVCNYGACTSGFGDCDGNRANGCETNTQTTLNQCGACGTDCNSTLQNTVAAGRTCGGGVCNYGTCVAGFADCDGNRANGCETNLQTSITSCGTCGTNCNMTLANTAGTGRSCSAGTCNYTACAPGFIDCDGNRANGCETSSTTLGNCGSCGNVCGSIQNATETCTASSTCDYMSCEPSFGDCNSVRTDGCETDLQSTLTNCGTCATNCNTTLRNTAAAGRMCSAGACDYGSCNANFGDCNPMRTDGCETDLRTTFTNCGACGTNCGTQLQNVQTMGRSCMASACNYTTCASGFGDCDGMRPNGCEAATNTVSRCGNCTTDCNVTVLNVATPTCMGGTACSYTGMCDMNFGDCDSNMSNGCETNLTNTVTRCGSCSTNCTTTVLNATRTCTAGVCGYSACNAGFADCDSNTANGCETALGTVTNCGACGHACDTDDMPAPAGAETCVAGRCQCGTGAGAPTSMVGMGQACPDMGPNQDCNPTTSMCQ